MENLMPCDNVGYRKRKLSQKLLEEFRQAFSQSSRAGHVHVPGQPLSPKPKNIPISITINKSEEKQKLESPIEYNITNCYHINAQERALLNISGTRYEIKWEQLEKFPKTRLGQLRKTFMDVEMRKKENEGISIEKIEQKLHNFEFWFDSQIKSFESIANFYRKGKLHFDDGLCPNDFAEDLKYWGIDDSYFSPCCLLKFKKTKNCADEEIRESEKFLQKMKDDEHYSTHDGAIINFLRNAFERPAHWMSKMTTYTSTFFIILSTLNMAISTVPAWQADPCRFVGIDSDQNQSNETVCRQTFLFYQNLIMPTDYNMPILEEIFMAWFTLEYLIRLLISTDKIKFFSRWLNTIDLLAILPFYLTLILKQIDVHLPFVQFLLIFRILRIFKLGRQSTGLYCLGVTFRKSSNQLGILLLFLCITSMIFSSLAYIAEKENPDDFHSIPDSIWWAVITMTTVGYGDVVPKTLGGKIIGIFLHFLFFIGIIAALVGLIIISLPVAAIVSNFSMSYDDKTQREVVLRSKYQQSKKENMFRVNTISNTKI